MNFSSSRREFLKQSSLASAGFFIGASSSLGKRKISPNEKLNIAVLGTANRAGSNIKEIQNENIVALCDIDDNFLDAAMLKFPAAKRYNDFRKLLDQKNIDAVLVSTPDHTHAVATIAALKSGRHVYCEKPLAHTVHEIRQVRETARKSKLVTQMGIQIHAGNNYHRVVETIQSGVIGKISECHVWCARTWTSEVPTMNPPLPKNIHWDLWLGPAANREYNPIYHPKNWRAFWDFGGGTLGDMGCHYMDLAFWALKLDAPRRIEAEGPPVKEHVTPPWLIVKYEYAARGELPPVNVTWYDGGKRPDLVSSGKTPNWKDGVLFVGEKGMLIADYGRHKLLPEKNFASFTPSEKFVPDSIGHHEEWIQACKNGGATSCNFNYSGALAEAVLLGNVAYRSGQKLEWNSGDFKITNTREADKFLSREYRKGWRI